MWVGAGVLAVGALIALIVPGRRPQRTGAGIGSPAGEPRSLAALTPEIGINAS